MISSRLTAALKRLAGTERAVVYAVRPEDAPRRLGGSTPFVQGGRTWWRFVEDRRRLDDGLDLNLIVSPRTLSQEERLLAVGWGTAFANSFLLVEPRHVDGNVLEPNREPASATEARLRAAYAEWNYWLLDDEGGLQSYQAELPLDASATLWTAVWAELPKRFRPADFLSALTVLNLREAELFTGGREVAQAIVPFLTRTGLPILYDVRHVMQAMRKLINAGLATAQDPGDNLRTYRGPSDPLPDEVTDERLALMLR